MYLFIYICIISYKKCCTCVQERERFVKHFYRNVNLPLHTIIHLSIVLLLSLRDEYIHYHLLPDKSSKMFVTHVTESSFYELGTNTHLNLTLLRMSYRALQRYTHLRSHLFVRSTIYYILWTFVQYYYYCCPL